MDWLATQTSPVVWTADQTFQGTGQSGCGAPSLLLLPSPPSLSLLPAPALLVERPVFVWAVAAAGCCAADDDEGARSGATPGARVLEVPSTCGVLASGPAPSAPCDP
jgi:hypothetical protein